MTEDIIRAIEDILKRGGGIQATGPCADQHYSEYLRSRHSLGPGKDMQTLDRFNDLVSQEFAPEQTPEGKKKAVGG